VFTEGPLVTTGRAKLLDGQLTEMQESSFFQASVSSPAGFSLYALSECTQPTEVGHCESKLGLSDSESIECPSVI
jgi:hypothetical protein